MDSGHQHSEGASGKGVRPRIRAAVSVIKWTALTAIGLLAVFVVLGVGGVRLPFWFPDAEVTHEKPYADFVGREYRVTSPLTALAWNDFPDKAKILVVSLTPPPGTSNRFVSYSIPLQPGQRVRILSAWRSFELVQFTNYYLVSVPGAGLPEGIPIKMRVNSDGIPDPLVYEALQSNSTPHRTRAQASEQLDQLAARAGERGR
jgi:hypothetical protein